MTHQTANPTLDIIQAHGSVRRYRPDPLPQELVETIVLAAQRASTSSNMQAYSVVAVTDAERRNQLADLCANQGHIRQAPLFLAWCADLARLDRVCTQRGYTQVSDRIENFLIAAFDAVIAAQNAALAAESLGLGICYIGSIRNHPRRVIEMLGLPRLVFPITGMTIGWPESAPRIRPRLPLQAVLHWEHYNSDQDAALREYDRTMAESGIYAERQVAVPGKPDVMEDYGWLEHSARRVSQVTRPDLRAVIEEQGFALR
jgi:FMN reductase (NADPH)